MLQHCERMHSINAKLTYGLDDIAFRVQQSDYTECLRVCRICLQKIVEVVSHDRSKGLCVQSICVLTCMRGCMPYRITPEHLACARGTEFLFPRSRTGYPCSRQFLTRHTNLSSSRSRKTAGLFEPTLCFLLASCSFRQVSPAPGSELGSERSISKFRHELRGGVAVYVIDPYYYTENILLCFCFKQEHKLGPHPCEGHAVAKSTVFTRIHDRGKGMRKQRISKRGTLYQTCR